MWPAPEQIDHGGAEFSLGEELETGAAAPTCSAAGPERPPVWSNHGLAEHVHLSQ